MNHELETKSFKEFESDVVDAAAAKKENLFERLNKRNKDRQNYFDVKLEQRNKENLQREGIDYFAQTFAERVREIETLLNNLSDTSVKKTVGDGPNLDLARLFADITMEIQELQQYLTSSTMFLTEFKIKACQNIVNELTSKCEERRSRLMPKKKFGFSGRKVAPRTAVNPKVAAKSGLDKLDASERNTLSGGENNVMTWTLSNRTDVHLLLSGDEVNGKDITISNLRGCLVELQGYAGSVQITNAVDCTFLCGPISRSFFAEHCENLTLSVACQQLRLHSSSQCRIYLHVTCRAIIEDCKLVEVGVYHYDYPTIEEDFQLAGISKTQNNYTDIADFNWLSPDVPSPNWRLIEDCAEPDWNKVRAKFKEKSANNTSL